MRQHAPARAECIDAWRWVGRALPAPAQARRSTAHARLVPGGTGPPKRPGGAGDGWLQTREPGGVWGSERRGAGGGGSRGCGRLPFAGPAPAATASGAPAARRKGKGPGRLPRCRRERAPTRAPARAPKQRGRTSRQACAAPAPRARSEQQGTTGSLPCAQRAVSRCAAVAGAGLASDASPVQATFSCTPRLTVWHHGCKGPCLAAIWATAIYLKAFVSSRA